MRKVTLVLALGVASTGVLSAGNSVANWEKGFGPQACRTTAKMTNGADLRIRVVSCPKGPGNGICVWKVNGNSSNLLKRWDSITEGQILKHKLSSDDVISISSIPVNYAQCTKIEQKGGLHQLTLELKRFGTWVLDVKVVTDF